MGDIPGFLASEFPDDARHVPGQEAYTERRQAEEEGQSDAGADGQIDEKQIFYKEDANAIADDPDDDRVAGQNPDESTYGDADL